MGFPPLKDPLEGSEEREGREPHGDGKRRKQPQPAAHAPGSSGGPVPSAVPGHSDAAETAGAGHEIDDDDLEELNDQIDPDDLDDLEDLVEHRAHNTPIPPDPGSTAAMAAGDIPMLTEVVQVPRYDTEDLPQTLADVDWGDLGQRVRENVLERLLRRSDALLDAQLQNTLTPVLERAAETVAHELHDALNRMIRDIVARAVTEELTRLHAEIAKRNRSSRQT